jgi:ABC-type nitrate/sulfonate/bicarbonate transport system substrate-binding protein
MKQAKFGRLMVGLIAGATLIAACGGGAATPAPASQAPATAAPASEAPASAPASTAPTGEVPKPELTSLKIGLSVTETSQYAAKLAQQADIYKKYGFDNVTVDVFEGDGKTMQALQAGQLDIGFVGVSSAITSQTTDAPVAIMSVNAMVLSDLLTSVASVKTAEDLKGKCVAVSTYGGTSHGAVILSLKALGLTPEDVVITEIGGQSARIAALEGGSCQAAPVDAAKKDKMAEAGFNFLVDLKKEGTAWGRSGAAVSKEWLAKNPNTALAFEAALLEAQNMMWTDAATAAKFYAEFNQIEQAEADGLVADFQTVGNRTMMWTDEAFENPKIVLSTVNPDVKDVDVTTAYDKSILDKLVTLGVYEKLGVPLQ